MTAATLHRPIPARLSRCVAPLAIAVAAAIPAGAARGDDFIDKANAMYLVMRKDNKTDVPVPPEKRSDLVLLPAVAAMAAPPPALDKEVQAILLLQTSRDWPAILAWAQAAPQRAVLDALDKITADEGPETHMVFAQPYGVDAVSVEMVAAGLYTELDNPPLLARADFKYLKKLDWVVRLAHVEANRLLAEGKAADAEEVLMNLLLFGRQMADRQLYGEKLWGLIVVGNALEHTRDIAYRDFKSSAHTLPIEKVKDLVKRLDDRTSPVGLGRLLLPAADRLASEQLLYFIYDKTTGTADADHFGTTLAHISTAERPLRLFSEAAKWDQVRPVAAKLPAIKDTLKKVADDYVYRWGLAHFDPTLAGETDYKKTVAGKAPMQVLTITYARYQPLFTVRQDLRVEAAGTRMSLAMYGYFLQNNTFPKGLTAARPVFAPVMDKDPYSPLGHDYEFFVPGRDTPKGPLGELVLHEMKVFPGDPFKPFSAKLDDKDFVIYSIGPDGDKGFAKDVMASSTLLSQGDYAIWPPVSSLLRSYLTQEGLLR